MKIIKSLVVCSLLFSILYAKDADGFDYPMEGASDYKDGLGYNEQYSGYYTGANTTNFNFTTNKPKPICEDGGSGGCEEINGSWKNSSDVGNYVDGYGALGLHPAEDWHYGNGKDDIGKEVNAIANGTVVDVRKIGNYGYQIKIKHTSKDGTTFKYPKSNPTQEGFESVDIGKTVYSIYLHVTNETKINGEIEKPTLKKKDNVTKGEIIARVADISNSSHLHFQLRTKEFSNYANKNGTKLSYYDTFEHLKNDGVLDPSDFIQANLKVTPQKPLTIPTITSIKECDIAKIYYDDKLELKPKFKPEKQCIQLQGTGFTISNSVVWWRVNNNDTVKPIASNLNVSVDGTTLNVNFGDYKPKDESEADKWEFIVTNKYQKEVSKQYSELANSPHISFKVLAYSDSNNENIITCENQNINFSDINGHKYEESILYIKNKCMVKGYDNGTYGVDNPITRAEFTKIVLLAKYSITEIEEATNQGFEDVSDNDWFAHYVNFAKENKFIIGYEKENKFKPNQLITFAEASKIIVNVLIGETEGAKTQTWWKPFIKALTDRQIDLSDFKKENSDEYNVQKNLTRGEMAYLIYSVLSGGK